ncbi:MAG: fluoride efflux transporter CrcB [Hyphomicrobiales bacterium]|nr:fluoride efflux transporter CrcB [Hyphomicrobiales bacterium]MDE2017522.1 fluoride efflux transporter CrcB [Hyphomicrobiales bacterium]
MFQSLIVFFGAGIGGVARLGVNVACGRWCSPSFPWATLVINVVGSTIMGLIAGWFAFRGAHPWTVNGKLFAMTGILGGFTTFSAFSLDTATLWERGQAWLAALYVAGSVGGALAGIFLGLGFMRSLP